MGDKPLPSRPTVGRLDDPWDEQRMKLALQLILQQMTVQPYRRIQMSPILRPYWNYTQVWADWFVELLIVTGIPAAFWCDQLGYGSAYYDNDWTLKWVNPAETVFQSPTSLSFLWKVNATLKTAYEAGRIDGESGLTME